MKNRKEIEVNEFIDALECCDSGKQLNYISLFKYIEKLFDINWFNDMIIKIKLKID